MSTAPTDRAHAHDVPIGEIVRSLAVAIVEAQAGLDDNAMRVAERMSGTEVLRDAQGRPVLDADGKVQTIDRRVFFGSTRADGERTPVKLSMLELGFTPTFYQFAETTVDLRLALRITRHTDEQGHTRFETQGTPVDAQYQGTFGYDLAGSCSFKTRIVPIPAPPLLEERVRLLLEEERKAHGLTQTPHGGEE